MEGLFRGAGNVFSLLHSSYMSTHMSRHRHFPARILNHHLKNSIGSLNTRLDREDKWAQRKNQGNCPEHNRHRETEIKDMKEK